jgi:hypothetical protein
VRARRSTVSISMIGVRKACNSESYQGYVGRGGGNDCAHIAVATAKPGKPSKGLDIVALEEIVKVRNRECSLPRIAAIS